MDIKDKFLSAIHSKNKLKVIFLSKEDGRHINRTCAPMDFGPGRYTRAKSDRFHFWDYDSDTGSHVLSLLPEQVVSLEIQEQHFEPGDFVTWQTKWIVPRNWGKYS